MKRILTAIAAAAIAAAASSVAARTVTDHLGRTVTLPEKVERVVTTSIYPLASVIAVHQGSARSIVGMHPVSMSAARSGLFGKLFPESLKAATGFMKGSSLNIEALMALRPDCVFVNRSDKPTLNAVINAGLPAVAVSATAWNCDVLTTYDKWIGLLDDVYGSSKTTLASAESARVLKLVRERTAAIPADRRRTVLWLMQLSEKQIVTSGSKFFGQYWCDAIGAKNAAASIPATNSIINMEQVYSWNPDIVFITNFTPAVPEDLYGQRFGNWAPVKAVAEKRVYKLPLGIYRSYTPGADTPLTLLWMAKTAYPEAFADIDMEKETERYYRTLFGVTLTPEMVRSMYEGKGSAAGFAGSPGSVR